MQVTSWHWALCTIILGCGKSETDLGNGRVPRLRPLRPSAQTEARRRARDSCQFRTGALPKDTLDLTLPLGKSIPIDHFIVVMQKGRSFDHYFQNLPAAGQPHIEVAPPTYQNQDPAGDGKFEAPFLLPTPCVANIESNWLAVRSQLDNQGMRGFLSAAQPNGKRALGYYDEKTLNYYYALANTFALADHYFVDVPGPGYPNRMYMHSATSFGHVSNSSPAPKFERPTLFQQLQAAGKSWIIYQGGKTVEDVIFLRLRADNPSHFRSIEDFHQDATSGDLPFYAWVESSSGGVEATDEQAPANVQVGQAWVASIVQSVMHSSNWSRSALFLTYDNHGGFFDHLVPPSACQPDAEPPHVEAQAPGAFNQLGPRVPLIVVSPFARAHFVSHSVRSHTSLLRLIQTRLGLPALTNRDANAEPPLEMFDFQLPGYLTPPSLPEPALDSEALQHCRRDFADKTKRKRD